MAQSINLIPQYEKHDQVKTKVVRASTLVSILILLVFIGLSFYMYYQSNQLKMELSGLESDITNSRGKITSLSKTEISARNLFTKYQVLSKFYKTKPSYSALLDEFRKRYTGSVNIETFTLTAGNQVSLSGSGDNYISIARFMSDITDPKFPGVEDDLQNLFTGVTLNSVNLNSSKNNASFFILVDYNPELLVDK